MKKMLIVLAVVLLSTQVQAGVVYDVGNDWPALGSGTVNPNGQWSYLGSDDLTNDNDVLLTPCIEYEGNRSGYWGGAEGDWPLMWHSFTYSDTFHNPGETTFQASRTGEGPQFCKARWTSDEDGIADISADFTLKYGVMFGWVVHNDTILFSSTDPAYEAYSSSVVVADGDTIDFVVATAAVGQPLGENSAVAVNGVVDFVVPEPLTMALLGLGSLVLLRKRR